MSTLEIKNGDTLVIESGGSRVTVGPDSVTFENRDGAGITLTAGDILLNGKLVAGDTVLHSPRPAKTTGPG